MTALRTGVHVGAGTDAHRVASYNPFVCLQWMLDGKTVSGQPTRSPDEIPGREQALRLYTAGSAWFSFDDGRRGSLEVGKDADFAILSQDILTVPVDRIACHRIGNDRGRGQDRLPQRPAPVSQADDRCCEEPAMIRCSWWHMHWHRNRFLRLVHARPRLFIAVSSAWRSACCCRAASRANR